MKKFLTSVVLLAALTALILAGCGNNSDQITSSAEGLEPFGSVMVIPSAVPSTGVMPPSSSATIAYPTSPTPENAVDTNPKTSDAPVSPSPSATAPTVSIAPQPTYVPEPLTTPTPSAEPDPTPPADPFGGSGEELQPYVGQPLSTLIAEKGYPLNSDYEPVDEENDSVEANGTLYFEGGFTVSTYRAPDGTETITSINIG